MSDQPSIRQAIEALLDPTRPFPPKLLYVLSDLDHEETRQLRGIWKTIPTARRRNLLEDLAELAEHDLVLMFEQVGLIGLEDEDDGVVVRAIDLLFEADDKHLPDKLLSLLKAQDRDELVRAAAANALGPYVYQGECEELPEDLLDRIETALLIATRRDPSDLVRRRALEAVSFSSNPEVSALIHQAAASDDIQWLETALFAMGRSANEIWKSDVLANLDHEELSVRLQAVHAVGGLMLEEARPCLVKLLKQKHLASDLRKEAIWSLGEIGGEQVVELLEALLDNADDDEEYMLLEEAIDKANLVNETSNFELLKVDESDQDHQDHSHNLEEDEDDLPEDDFDDEEWNRYVDEDDLADEEDEESYDFEDPFEDEDDEDLGF